MNQNLQLPEVEEMVTTERVAIVVWLLSNGRAMSTAEVAGITGITHGGAWRLLARLCRVLPLTLEDNVWRCME